MRLLTCESLDRPVERGEIVYAVAVSGANILRDMREAVINTIGGHMTKYEALLDRDHRPCAGQTWRRGRAPRATTACWASVSSTPPSPTAPSQ